MTDELLPEVRAGVERALRERGGPALEIHSLHPVGGGCIHRALRLECSDGSRAFLKCSAEHGRELFEAEAAGLEALAAAHALRIPAVIALGGNPGRSGSGWILMEYVEPGRGAAGSGARLGRGLAEQHRSTVATRWSGELRGFGWLRDNYIGPLPQDNAPESGWGRFWADRRIRPLLDRAGALGLLPPGDGGPWDRLVEAIPGLLSAGDQEGPSLLHGDLWSGNVLFGVAGEPVLVDPAVYLGHREVDLAMAELFGGFPPSFYEAYEAEAPLCPGYPEARRAAYQLYPLLVHLVLFGRAYLGRALAARDHVLAAAG